LEDQTEPPETGWEAARAVPDDVEEHADAQEARGSDHLRSRTDGEEEDGARTGPAFTPWYAVAPSAGGPASEDAERQTAEHGTAPPAPTGADGPHVPFEAHESPAPLQAHEGPAPLDAAGAPAPPAAHQGGPDPADKPGSHAGPFHVEQSDPHQEPAPPQSSDATDATDADVADDADDADDAEAGPWGPQMGHDAAPAPDEETDAGRVFHVEHDDEPTDVEDDAPQHATPPPAMAPLRRPRFDRGRILAVANQKGGVGKTTTAVSLAAAVAETGAQVLLVDLDPQGNASSGLGMRPGEEQATIYHVLVEELDILDAVVPANVRNLFLVPTNIDLAGAEIELVSMFSREQRLRRALHTVTDEFDLIIVDCPPSLGLLTVNALTAADGVIVPIQCEYYALEGLGALRRNTDLVRENLNPALEIAGFVLTMLDARTRLSQQVVEEVRRHFGDRVFRTTIPRSVRLAEAPSFSQPITVFDSGSRGAMAYRRLASELLDRLSTHART
jgi:chromosome partitioning protein